MTSPLVRIEKNGRIAVVRFDAPTKSNALSHDLMRQLTDAARSFEGDSETSAIILTGRDDLFTLGMDLSDPELAASRTAPLSERRQLLQVGPRMCRAWEDLEPITIAAIEGWCVGGGVALTSAFDFRVAGRGAHFYVPEVERGMNMSWGSLPRLANLCGPARTKKMVILAEKLDAEKAERWGFVDDIADDGHAFEAAMRMAERLAALPPVAVRMCKQGIDNAVKALNRTASALDMDQFALAQSADDYAEGLASFLEKRPAKYTGN